MSRRHSLSCSVNTMKAESQPRNWSCCQLIFWERLKKIFLFLFHDFSNFPNLAGYSTRRFWRWSRQWTRTGTAARSKLQFHVMMGAPPLISTTKAEMDTISPPENKTLPLLPNIRSVSCTISILSFCFKICFLLGPLRRCSDWLALYLEGEPSEFHLYKTIQSEASNWVEEGLWIMNVVKSRDFMISLILK